MSKGEENRFWSWKKKNRCLMLDVGEDRVLKGNADECMCHLVLRREVMLKGVLY